MPANPISPYAISKYAGEQYCKVFTSIYGLETVALRYFNVFGPHQNPESQYAAVIPLFINAVLNGKPITIHGDGEQTRDFTHVENVVQANLLACHAEGAAGEMFNIACGLRTSINQLAKIIKELMNAPDHPVIYTELRPGDVKHSLADISKAKSILGYEPKIDLVEGLEKLWYIIKIGIMTDTNKIKVCHVATIDRSIRFLLLNQLLSLQEAGYDVTAVCNPGPYITDIESAGIRVIPVTMKRTISPMTDLYSLWTLYNLFLREQFTIVHTHNPKPGLLGQLAAKIAKVPIIVNTVHGFYFHDDMKTTSRRFHITLEKIAATCSDRILSQNSEDIKTAISEKISPPEKIKYLGNGIDLTQFNPSRFSNEEIKLKKEELKISNEEEVVGFVGRIVREKGILELYEAFSLVKKQIPNIKLLIVGRVDIAKNDAIPKDVVEEFGIAKDTIFTGHVKDPAIYVALMDVFVLPSHREGFPRSPMEASAMGKPIIVTNIRGCREVIENRRNGVMVPLNDVKSLSKAIYELLTNEEKVRKMGKEGRKIALERFDEQLVFERVKSEYSQLLRSLSKSQRLRKRNYQRD